MTRLLQSLPLLTQLRRYRAGDARADMAAGLTTAVMLVPQAMAYAMLAGLPPHVGLYASVVPLFIYALLGSSRQLAVGPVAMVSILVAGGLADMAVPGSDQYVALAVVLALISGLALLGMGLVRLGFLVELLSHPVIAGFTYAAALIIAASQLGNVTGIALEGKRGLLPVLGQVAAHLGEIHSATLIVGVSSVAALLAIRRWAPRIPAALVVVVGATGATWLLGLDAAGVAVVGAVPAGLPSPSLPSLPLSEYGAIVPTALAIALVGYAESISVAKAFAHRGGYRLDPDKELVSLGLANIGGSLFGAYPVTGGFSRTAVNARAGARTGLASAITAVAVAITLLFLTPLFTLLPKAALAAIILVAVIGLVDLAEVRRIWHVRRKDAGLLAVAFLGTLLLGVEEGIGLGVVVSLATFVWRAARPHCALLGRIPGTRVWRDLAYHPEAETVPGVAVMRVDASLYFANAEHLRRKVHTLRGSMGDPLRAFVLDASAINDLDSTAADALLELAHELEAEGVRFLVAGAKPPGRQVMERATVCRTLGDEAMTLDVEEAVERAQAMPLQERRSA